jgi:carbon storage regulator CsrA
MLVLTRKQSETIQIGDEITITVLRMKGKSVRIGIKAPHDMNVIRGELAFERSEELGQAEGVEDVGTTDAGAPSRLRTSGPRQDSSWSPKSEPPAAVKVGCPAAWSI